MAKLKRLTLSLPGQLVSDIDFVATRLGVTRSAFVTQLLISADIASIRALVQNLPSDATEGDVKRFRGSSKEYVRERMEALKALQGGLFDDTE